MLYFMGYFWKVRIKYVLFIKNELNYYKLDYFLNLYNLNV